MSQKKKTASRSHQYTPAQMARLRTLYERMEALSEKDFEKELKKLDRETTAALAAYMTVQNVKKGLRSNNSIKGKKKPVLSKKKWQRALRLKKHFDSLDEETSARELKELSADDLNSLATITAYLNEQKNLPKCPAKRAQSDELRELETLSRKVHAKIDFTDITDDDINKAIDEYRQQLYLRRQPNTNKRLIDMALKSPAARTTTVDVHENLERTRHRLVASPLTSNPKVMSGALVLRGTRIPIATVLDELIAGNTIADFVEGHPRVTCEEVETALLFIRNWLKDSFGA